MRNLIAATAFVVLSACEQTNSGQPNTASAPAATSQAQLVGLLESACTGTLPQRNFGRTGAQALISRGWADVQAGQFDPAVRKFAEAALLHKARPDAFWGLGVAGHGARLADPLLNAWFERGEGMFDADPAGFDADRGRVLEERGQAAEAVPVFQKALALDPEHREANVGIARAYLAMGDEAAAAPHIVVVQRLEARQ